MNVLVPVHVEQTLDDALHMSSAQSIPVFPSVSKVESIFISQSLSKPSEQVAKVLSVAPGCIQ